MSILSMIRRGLGGPPRALPLVWLDAVECGLADVRFLETELIVVPTWSERRSVAQLLMASPVRLVIEHHESDLTLAALAARAWGSVCWKGSVFHARPVGLIGSSEARAASEQLAKAQRIRQSDISP